MRHIVTVSALAELAQRLCFQGVENNCKTQDPQNSGKKAAVQDGKMDMITNFTSNAGKQFDAKLQLVNGDLKFSFDGRNV